MALSIPQIIRQFKGDVASVLAADSIAEACDAVGHTWRDRILNPIVTVHVFLMQILHGNTACSALSRLAGITFTAAAYCNARARLPVTVLAILLIRVCKRLLSEHDANDRWHGHRTHQRWGGSPGFHKPVLPEGASVHGLPEPR